MKNVLTSSPFADQNIQVQCDEKDGAAQWFIRYRKSSDLNDAEAPGELASAQTGRNLSFFNYYKYCIMGPFNSLFNFQVPT